MGDPDEQWVFADSAWWGRDHRLGPCALRLRRGIATEPPVPARNAPASSAALHLTGTLIPGLRDAHVHSGLVEPADIRAGGIALVNDLGSGPARLSELLTSTDPALPRIRCVGRFLTAPGGYPSTRPWAQPDTYREVSSVRDAHAAVDEQRVLGASSIKVALHRDAGPVPAENVLAEIVGVAHERDLEVVAHAEGEGMFRMALRHGIDRLAHTPWTETLPDEMLSVAAGMTWISTLDIHGYGNRTADFRRAVNNLRGFRRFGGTVQYGTDLGNGPLPVGINTREIEALREAGMSGEDVLDAMTEPGSPAPPCVVRDGLDLEPDRFAASLSGARVLSISDDSSDPAARSKGGGP